MIYRWYEIAAEYSFQIAPGIQLIDRASYAVNPYNYLSSESLSIGPGDTVERSYLFFGHDWRPLYNQLELELKGSS